MNVKMTFYLIGRYLLLSIAFLAGSATMLAALRPCAKFAVAAIMHTVPVLNTGERMLSAIAITLIFGLTIGYLVCQLRSEEYKDEIGVGDVIGMIIELLPLTCLILWKWRLFFKGQPSVIANALAALFCFLWYIGFCSILFHDGKPWQMKCRYIATHVLPDSDLYCMAINIHLKQRLRKTAMEKIGDPTLREHAERLCNDMFVNWNMEDCDVILDEEE